jgi:hypothetical protein
MVKNGFNFFAYLGLLWTFDEHILKVINNGEKRLQSACWEVRFSHNTLRLHHEPK